MDSSEVNFHYSSSQDLNLYYCGKRINSLNHKYGPTMKNHMMISLILSGSATAFLDGEEFRIQQGQIFVMFPNSAMRYVVDKNSLWTIKWIGISGKMVYEFLDILGITYKNPVFTVQNASGLENILDRIYELCPSPLMEDKLTCLSLIYQYFSVLFKDANIKYSSNNYISSALRLIRYRYDEFSSVAEIANELNLNPNYFSKLFKKEVGVSPSSMLHRTKIDRASFLLGNTNLPISEIALAVGIQDQFYFCRFFKKYMYISPSEYRKYIKNKQRKVNVK